MNIIGLSAFYHESTCCLLQDGVLVAAVPEERFTRVKHDRRAPINAFRYCLQAGGDLSPADIDCIAYYESPAKKLSRQLSMNLDATVDPRFEWLDPGAAERQIRESLGYAGPILTFEHHQSHGASAFFYSGFRDAAVMTVDGVGEWATTTYGRGRDETLSIFEEVHFPHSLGLLYSTLTDYLGFRVLSDEYKVMGLAPYGKPRFVETLGALLSMGPGGQFRLNQDYFAFNQAERMFTPALEALFGRPRRVPESAFEGFHYDLARSLQRLLEDTLLEKVRYLYEVAPSKNLCLAGGVALNCVANGRIHREGPFENLFVQPAAGDSGTALGAAALAHIERTGTRHTYAPLSHVYLGPDYDADAIGRLIDATGIEALDFRGDTPGLLAAVVDRLDAQKVVGWFHGRMEFGPRALGARSILADPRDPEMRDRINAVIKKREAFRPFAPACLESRVHEHMTLAHPSRFMLETCQVDSPLDLPAITHVDGSARVQTVVPETNPRFAALLEAFAERTGCPMVVNTSFNVRGEPIVCTPEDAIRCMANSQLDALVLEDFIIDKAAIPAFLRRAARLQNHALADATSTAVDPRLSGGVERWRPADGVLPDGVYTFV